jgi:hypothetical protein
LEQEGIISSNYVGHMRLIKLNSNNPKTAILLKALKLLKNQRSYK